MMMKCLSGLGGRLLQRLMPVPHTYTSCRPLSRNYCGLHTRTDHSRIGCDYLRVPSYTFDVVISLGEMVVFHESREDPIHEIEILSFPIGAEWRGSCKCQEIPNWAEIRDKVCRHCPERRLKAFLALWMRLLSRIDDAIIMVLFMFRLLVSI